MPKTIEPQLGLASFSCPHCGAIAQQTWWEVFIARYEGKSKPVILRYEDAAAVPLAGWEDKDRERFEEFRDRLKEHALTYENREYARANLPLVNITASWCHSCVGFAIWVEGRIVYPDRQHVIEAHEDMPATVKRDFDEAASILAKSPRGAAALLRLCIQKLMIELKLPGNNINADIGALVAGGLDSRIQKALDIVRVVGNNAVHPGQIDLEDDQATAVELFKLVNLIVQDRISTAKKIDEMYASLPEGAREAIEKRDAEK
jgi:hypothetical protein